MHECCRIGNDVIHLAVKVVPGASKTEFAGIKDNRLRIRIAAAPEDGKANAELCAFIAKALGCPKRDIQLLRGEKSRQKTIALPVACEGQLQQLIENQ